MKNFMFFLIFAVSLDVASSCLPFFAGPFYGVPRINYPSESMVFPPGNITIEWEHVSMSYYYEITWTTTSGLIPLPKSTDRYTKMNRYTLWLYDNKEVTIKIRAVGWFYSKGEYCRKVGFAVSEKATEAPPRQGWGAPSPQLVPPQQDTGGTPDASSSNTVDPSTGQPADNTGGTKQTGSKKDDLAGGSTVQTNV